MLSIEAGIQRNTCTFMFRAVSLYIRDQSNSQKAEATQHLSVDEQMNNMWSIQNTGHYSALKSKEIQTHAQAHRCNEL